MFKSLFSKLFSTYLIITLLTLTILGVFLFRVFENIYFESKINELENQATKVVELIEDNFEEEGDSVSVQNLLDSIDGFLDAKVWVIDQEGRVVGYTRRMTLQDDFIIDKDDEEKLLKYNESISTRGYHPSFDEQMLTVALPIESSGEDSADEAKGAVFLHAPIVDFIATITQKRQFIFYAAGIATLCSIITAFFLSKSISTPLFKMNKAAFAMAEGNFKQRVPVETKDEVGQLSETFNYLSGKLQDTIDELQQERDKLEGILQGIGEGVIAIDKGNNLLLANNQAYELLNIYLNQEMLEFPSLQEYFEKVMDNGETLEKEVNLNDERLLFVVVTPLKSSDDKIWGSVAVLRDITELRRLENMRKEFVANVSHELRTPLTSIRGFLEALIDDMVTDEKNKKRHLEIIMDETLRLDRLINNLLDLSKIESREDDWEYEEVDLGSLVDQIITKLKPQVMDKEIVLVNEISSDISNVFGSRDRISQIIMNLLDNAINFTQKGGEIKVSAKYLEKEKKVEVSIKDNGQGIPQDDLEKIWQRFHKVEKSRNRGIGGRGTGLGLSIVKHLVESHGGEINVESEYGKGSTFSFTLKACVCEKRESSIKTSGGFEIEN
ncbi:ATP-binding protein [Natranaerofaba carboxydovora]|uniref:ATP-binding protein n=1 Tax=Natranaerofaba carboxydovora TaxID=2742683 RepID=UPI001F13DD91|nr:ATP-binding protein [Natranaerofaba carboxydovora]UMZ73099.1 Sensor histidine kinase ResE [Natranaerofaba carboxydovora]